MAMVGGMGENERRHERRDDTLQLNRSTITHAADADADDDDDKPAVSTILFHRGHDAGADAAHVVFI